jgi:hypothetical protein
MPERPYFLNGSKLRPKTKSINDWQVTNAAQNKVFFLPDPRATSNFAFRDQLKTRT